MDRDLYLIIDNVRSSENIGSLLRTADGLGIKEVLICGYSPYPKLANNDTRLPHIINKIDAKIHKTALGTEKTQVWNYYPTVTQAINYLKQKGIPIIGLEQTNLALKLNDYQPPDRLGLVIGNEITGIDQSIVKLCNVVVEIPMIGKKESFNVSIAMAMAMFYFRYMV